MFLASRPVASRSIFFVLLMAFTLVVGSLGCSTETARQPDILLITVDTLRPDHLGLYGYERPTSPRIDAFFAYGAIFERSYSVEANTPQSVLTLISGLPPRHHGVRSFYELLSKDVEIVPDRLPGAYQSAAFVSNIVLTDEAIGIGGRFDYYDDFVDEPESDRDHIYERRASRTTDAALKWLTESRDPERPLFLWVHYIDPHGPYDAPEGAPQRFEHANWSTPPKVGRIAAYQFDPEITNAYTYVDRYDEEIAYTDLHVGRLLDGYGANAKLDDAFVVLTADHGESMIEHGLWFTHGYHVWNEILRVPLMIRGPGVEAGRRTGLTSGIDVAPTLLAAAGVAGPEARDELGRGFDLRRDQERPDRVVVGEASLNDHRWRMGVRGNDKWIFSTQGERVIPKFHYDLTKDPGELGERQWFVNPPPKEVLALIETDPIDGTVAADRKGQQLRGPKIDPRVTEAQRKQLEALGYGNTTPKE